MQGRHAEHPGYNGLLNPYPGDTRTERPGAHTLQVIIVVQPNTLLTLTILVGGDLNGGRAARQAGPQSFRTEREAVTFEINMRFGKKPIQRLSGRAISSAGKCLEG